MRPPEVGSRVLGSAVRLLGSRVAVADYLRVERSLIDDWLRGPAAVPVGVLRRLEALVAVQHALARLPRHALPPGWLRLPCADLDGATPEDVLAVDGPGRVLDLLARITRV